MSLIYWISAIFARTEHTSGMGLSLLSALWSTPLIFLFLFGLLILFHRLFFLHSRIKCLCSVTLYVSSNHFYFPQTCQTFPFLHTICSTSSNGYPQKNSNSTGHRLHSSYLRRPAIPSLSIKAIAPQCFSMKFLIVRNCSTPWETFSIPLKSAETLGNDDNQKTPPTFLNVPCVENHRLSSFLPHHIFPIEALSFYHLHPHWQGLC